MGSLTNAPVEAQELIRENDLGNGRIVRRERLERMALGLAGDRPER